MIVSMLVGKVTSLFWYVVLFVATYAIFPEVKIFRYLAGILGLMLFSFSLSLVLRYQLFYNLPLFVNTSFMDALIPNVVNAVCIMLIIGLSLHHIHIQYQMKSAIMENWRNERKQKTDLLDIKQKEKQKYENIFALIEQYFETKEPYLNSDFKITQMANDLNINIVYLTKAIHLKKNMNFNSFVNFYRIEKSKELMQTNTQKYSLLYIYLSSGFHTQSCFNKAFKAMEEITPSEYYKKLKNSDNEI
ncbi:MAG: helix-turn-helix domain-containing protein [Prevotella sp.]|jgi:AraC-like DNA-binding protein|nr:helix-turn-helix domain-containing protein [Prevotella sp.]